MLKSLTALFLALFCCHSLAQSINPHCIATQDENFPIGDGRPLTPFLICNHQQLTRLSNEPALLTSFFTLGTDLSFKDRTFSMIGSAENPFRGGFDGRGYTFRDISLDNNQATRFVAPFAAIDGARIENLFIDGVTRTNATIRVTGGLVAQADNANLFNVHVKRLNLRAPDGSGGLVGVLRHSFIGQASAEGQLIQHFGTDGSGGLVGTMRDSQIKMAYANVDLTTTSPRPFGVSMIGALVGSAVNSQLSDVHANGDIDYRVAEHPGPRHVGGLIGALSEVQINRAYYAGNMNIDADFLGGAVGDSYAANLDRVYWDRELTGVTHSAGGVGKETHTLFSRAFWVRQHFDERNWNIQDGKYPSLIFDN